MATVCILNTLTVFSCILLCCPVLGTRGRGSDYNRMMDNTIAAAYAVIIASMLCLALVAGIIACIFLCTDAQKQQRVKKKRKNQPKVEEGIHPDNAAGLIKPESKVHPDQWPSGLSTRENLIQRVKSPNS